MTKIEKNRIFYGLLLVATGYFLVQLFLSQNLAMNSDEGTHAITGLFYKDLIYNFRNIRSLSDVIQFIINYTVKYSKVTLYYPPLYHLLLSMVFSIQENIVIARVLNILLTILTSYAIYKLSYEIFNNKKISFLSFIFFLSFSIIFFYANKVMIDILQILTFSVSLWYYFKLKKKKTTNLNFKNLLILSILVAISLLTKFYSIFIPIIILVDSFFYDKRFFKKMFIALVISCLLISPYAFFYYKYQMYKLVIGKAMSSWETSTVFFDVFRNFGVFLGFYVAFSLIYFFYKNRKNYIFFIWFFIPLITLLCLKNSDPRFAFILMPIYAMACAFSFTKIEKMFREKWKRCAVILFISSLVMLQLTYNVFLNSQGQKYPVDEIMKSIKKDGNVLILSEDPVYSSVFMFYGRVNNISGNIIRSCVFFKNNLTKEFLHDWGIRYIIDQKNILDESLTKSLDVKPILEKDDNEISIRLFELNEDVDKVNCNFVCILMGKVCKGMEFSEIIPLINKNIYVQ